MKLEEDKRELANRLPFLFLRFAPAFENRKLLLSGPAETRSLHTLSPRRLRRSISLYKIILDSAIARAENRAHSKKSGGGFRLRSPHVLLQGQHSIKRRRYLQVRCRWARWLSQLRAVLV